MGQQNCCKMLIEVHLTMHLLCSDKGLTTNSYSFFNFSGFRGDPMGLNHKKYVLKFTLCRLGQTDTKHILW